MLKISTPSLRHCLPLGAGLLAHPGEEASGDIIVVSAPRCTLLRATEELGLCKTYKSKDMEAFSYNDRDNFKDSGTPVELWMQSWTHCQELKRDTGKDVWASSLMQHSQQ